MIIIKIVKADIIDLEEILELQYIAYQSEAKLFNSTDIPPLKQTIDELRDEYEKGIILKVLDDTGSIIGSVRAYYDNGTVYIGKLMVHPTHQRKGIATKLLNEMEGCYPKARYELFTSTRSERNIHMYEKQGYKAFKMQDINDELKFVYFEKFQ